MRYRVLLVLLTGMFTAFSAAHAETTEPRAALRLALNWVPEPEFGGFYAAQAEGLFTARGLQVELLPGGAGTPTVQMLEAGKVELAVTSGSEVAIARSRGARVLAVYSVFESSPMGIMVHASRGLDSLAELFASPGLIALQQGQPYVDFLQKRFPGGEARIVPYAGGVTQFLHDERFAQQGFVFSEPITARQSGVEPRFLLLAEEGYNPYVAVVAVREDFLARNEAQVRAFVEAVREGWARYREAPQAANAVMSKLNSAMTPSAFEAGAQAQNALLGDGSMTEARWSEHIGQLREAGSLTGKVQPADCFRNP